MLEGHSSVLISDYTLMRATADVKLTQFQLIKMVFIAHGRHLACTGMPLISDRIEAWRHGPVIPILYHELKAYGDEPVSSLRYCNTPLDRTGRIHREFFACVLNDTERQIIDAVVNDYGDWTVSQLYQLCHENGSPWDRCYTGKYGVEIPDYVISEYYKSEMMTQ